MRAGNYRAAIPPRIGSLDFRLSGELSAESEDALREIVRFDEYASQRLGSSTELAPVSSILLRSESAASSQIENLTVGARSLALAELSSPSSRNASIVSGNVRAMEAALAVSSTVSAESVLAMHRALMDPPVTLKQAGGAHSRSGSVAPTSVRTTPHSFHRIMIG